MATALCVAIHKDHGDGMKADGYAIIVGSGQMKVNRRCKEMDELLGKRVRISFKDGTAKEGILRFSTGTVRENYGIRLGRYYILTKTGTFEVYKCNVRYMEKLNVRKD